MKEGMDRSLAYRNLLAMEDHLDELLYSSLGPSEYDFLEGVKREVEDLRDGVMPKEVDPRYHCLVKHCETAYEALREVSKVTHDMNDVANEKRAQMLLYELLERLWGRRLITCERCGANGHNIIQEEIGGSDASSSDGGITGDISEGSSSDREPVISSSEAIVDDGDGAVKIECGAEGEEATDNAVSEGDDAREDHSTRVRIKRLVSKHRKDRGRDEVLEVGREDDREQGESGPKYPW